MSLSQPQGFSTHIVFKGLERIVSNSDAAGPRDHDPLAVPLTVLEMKRLGISEDTIRQIVRDHRPNFYSLDVE